MTTDVRAADSAPAPFDPREPVPQGITLLEASAGTGKTHAVASLVVREVAEGRDIDELLVVTFTRKATGTLRERVWQRLAQAVRALTAGAGPRADDLLVHLCSGPPELTALRRKRLERALSDFDAATIATTHGFCQHVLASLGVAGDAERDLVVVEDIGTLVADAVDDLFVRRFHDGREMLFSRDDALRIAEAVIAHPDCEIAEVELEPAAHLRQKFAFTLRDRINDQKRRGRIITYDDLLARLDSSLGSDERGGVVAERLRRRYSMAVVDEFQDTDSVQWHILRRAFGAPPSRLVLVGDPKQAIYGFRGGDVFAYLDATRYARSRRSLPVSWRADQPLLDAIDAIFDGAQLGDESIRHRPLRARPGAEHTALVRPAVGAPLTVRIAERGRGSFALTAGGWAEKSSVREFVAADLAAEAVRLLSAGTTINGRTLGPGDLAVLTRTRRDADTSLKALSAVGVPAVVHAGPSVFSTAAARWWLDLLRALERPSYEIWVNTVACGPFFGWDPARLATSSDTDREELDAALHDWAAAFHNRSIAGLVQRIEGLTGLTARLCGRVGGERDISDLRHVAELLQAQHTSQPGSIASLARWLTEQIKATRADIDLGTEVARRRVESDADAVAVHTIHGAKGLEFPIVLLPCIWDAPWTESDALPVFHDDQGQRAIGVGGSGGLHKHQAELAAKERDEEDLRLLYVSLTRARHQVIAWWASAHDADRSAFARVLLERSSDGKVAPRLQTRPDETSITKALFERGIAVQRASGTSFTRFEPPPSSTPPLSVRTFERPFDRNWVRASYTGLTRRVHESRTAEAGFYDEHEVDITVMAAEPVEVDERAKVDEPFVTAPSGPAAGLLASPLPLAALPGGARIGTLVHDVLERVDFAAPDLIGELGRAAVEAGAARILEGRTEALVGGLARAIETPLGPRFGNGRLRDLRRADRRDELTFDLPLAGGDSPGQSLVTMAAIADVFAGLPDGDPLAAYHERLRDPVLANAMRGFLTGSIDLVARLGERFVVVDYKTNHLAPPGDEPLAWHYRPAALVQAMQDAHYPLQAAFYSVALHRYLRWRLHGYRPEQHLGGVAYLFLKGMTGATTALVDGAPCGVFAWTPPAEFVIVLSDLLDRGTADWAAT